MTPKSLGKMTLADFEAAAARWEKAARTIEKARALIGVEAPRQVAPSVPQPDAASVEAAREERLMRQRAVLEEIRNDPRRAQMLSQFGGGNLMAETLMPEEEDA